MRVLVTGGAGLIGSNLAFRLHQLGHEVTILDNLWRGNRSNLRAFFSEDFIASNLIVSDLTDSRSTGELVRGFDKVFHLADVVGGINFVFGNEHFTFSQNVRINSNTLSAAIKNGIPHYIYVGTACSYPEHLTTGEFSGQLLREEDAYPANPESAYGWSKLMGEYELEVASKAGLIDSTILRLHNVYGFPTEFSEERSQVIPALARKVAMYPSEEYVVWGSGKQRRSFVYVDDVVDALVLAMDLGVNQGPIQIGPNSSTSIAEIAHVLAELSGKDVTPTFDTAMPEGDGDRAGDNAKALALLGWSSSTSLREGLKKTYEWIRVRTHSDTHEKDRGPSSSSPV